ncbi:RNA 2',3'-cyclic phosphodiesterase [Tsuneonella amylolytica]|uniref:RNA 2',3'-cyclic phosphodiesterase n=1 Tax=Tsuneonella amylolytica TaxID=2338327 RepID=UPI000EA8C08F|nr:RNA 2',3'-cyclic phosphodiesterase [Tsuneonella amylolytica]
MRRLFVALRPPEPVREALLSVAGGVEGARWQSDDQLHLTLRFAGDVSRRGEDDLIESLSKIEHEPFPLQVRGVGHFEKRGRANGLWAAFAPSPSLASLQRKVERACRGMGLAAEPRTFVPHVTLARLGGRAIGGGEWLARHGDFVVPEWLVEDFRLYESTLHPDGSRYTPIAGWSLGPDR